MRVLVLGGTRFMGRHLVKELIDQGYNVTIATRGLTPDEFGHRLNRIIVDRTDSESMRTAFINQAYDVVFDTLAYCSNDIKTVMEAVRFKKYIMVSTTAVYQKHWDTKEQEFDPLSKDLIWCGRTQFPYDEIKRQAECALWQKYSDRLCVSVRFPFVIGSDDYTNRLFFYVEHIIKGISMDIDNYEKQMAFVRSDEAGKFIAFFAENDYCGYINGSSEQTISLKQIAEYVERKTGKQAILSSKGDKAPYNGETEYSINVDLAASLGFSFTPLNEWIYDLLDLYIDQVNRD